jgi:hypothetical protein
MKSRFYAVVASLLLIAGCTTAKAPSTDLEDAEIAKLLIGKWDLSEKEGLRSTTGYDLFRADGTFFSEALVEFTGNRYRGTRVSGKWKVLDGNLVETIESAEPPIHDKGTVYRLRVIGISATQLVTEGAGGIVVTRKRLADR